MRRGVILLAVGGLIVASPERAYLQPPDPAAAEPDAAESSRLCSTHWRAPTPVVRRAVHQLAAHQVCAATTCLADLVDDGARDAYTRAQAALAIGEIGCAPGGGRARRPLEPATVAALESAAADPLSPATVRQASVRALGRARAGAAVSTLSTLRDGDHDPVVRFLAAQALTRITRADHFDARFRDALLAAYLEEATTYRIVEAP